MAHEASAVECRLALSAQLVCDFAREARFPLINAHSERQSESLLVTVGSRATRRDRSPRCLCSISVRTIKEPPILAFMQKITVAEDPALTARVGDAVPTRITAILADGQRVSREVNDIPGFAGKPMQRPGIDRKFRGNIESAGRGRKPMPFCNRSGAREYAGYRRVACYSDGLRTGLRTGAVGKRKQIGPRNLYVPILLEL